MCLNPVKIADVGWVACRECWQCRERKVDDWVGRNIAESKTAKAAHVVTLTYGEDRSVGGIDHLRAAVLTYSDVQKFLKHLRIDGYPVRYFAVGEYGSKKGRAHWHIVLYWQGAVPQHKLRENFMQKHWPHGLSYWDKLTPEAVRYACKYLTKDMGDDARQGFGPMPSKKPPLGDAYFRQLAARYVEEGLAPQDLFYSFPEVRRVGIHTRGKTIKTFREAAKPIRFMMQGKTAENFCDYFVEGWRAKYDDEPPQSPVIWSYLNKKLEAYVDSITLPSIFGKVEVWPEEVPEGAGPVTWCALLKRYTCEANGEKLYLVEINGERIWRSDPRVWQDEVFETKAQRRERELREGIRF